MAGLACPAKPWRRQVPPSTFFLGREAKTWPLMQTAPPSRIMLGGAALNPDSEIPRQLSVCGGVIRFNGRRQLRRPYASVPDAPWKFLVRGPSTGWRYHMIFISSSTRSLFEGIAHSRRRLAHHRDRADAADRPGRAGADGAAQRGGWWKCERRSRSRGVNPTSSAYVVAGRQQLHFFWGGTEHLTPHASRFGSVS
jgi:hypothetical protein